MTVFENRFRRAYVQKRTPGQMVAWTLLLLAAMGSCSVATRNDERDERAMQEVFTKDLRARVIGWQTARDSNFERGR